MDQLVPQFKVGDWVEHGGLIGFVGAAQGGNIYFNGLRTRGDKYRYYKVKAFVRSRDAKLLPLENFEDANRYLIELALDTHDENWFYELTKKEGNISE